MGSEMCIRDSVILGNLYIGKQTKIGPDVVIQGNNIIGDYCDVRYRTFLRGDSIIGDYAEIASEVKNSYILDSPKNAGAAAAHYAYIGDSVIGRSVNLGAGTKLSNVKVFWTKVKINVEGKKYDTGLYKFGAVLGDNSGTGCNVVTSPGTLIGKRTKIYPNLTVGGYIPKNKIVKPSGLFDIKERGEETLESRE